MFAPCINYTSLSAVVGSYTDQIMVYGFEECYWTKVAKLLEEEPTGPVKKVFDHFLGSPDQEATTLEGRVIHKIAYSTAKLALYKAALVNMIYENMRREKEGLPLIPILFIIDNQLREKTYYPPSAIDTINNRTVRTLKELRCAYKLCEDPTLPEEVREVANRTFKFVRCEARIALNEGFPILSHGFIQLYAPWQGPLKADWDKEWSTYKAKKAAEPLTPEKAEHIRQKTENGWPWRPQLIEAISKPIS